jgi:tetratricopeptide (TPR) repeat protein
MQPNDQEWIDRYILGELNESELLEFRNRCKTDPAFGSEVALHVAAWDTLDLNRKKELKKVFESPELKDLTEKTLRTIRIWAWFRWFIPVLLLLTGAVCFLVLNQKKQVPPSPPPANSAPPTQNNSTLPPPVVHQNDQHHTPPVKAPNTAPETGRNARLFAANFQPAQNSIKTRGLKEAEFFRLYDEKKYREAIQVFPKSPEIPDHLFFYANALLAAGQTEEAVSVLKTYLPQASDNYQNAANWRLALAYLKLNKIKEAKAILTALSQSDDARLAPPATKLLSEL